MWTWFKDMIFFVIQWFHGFTGDWGMAIIMITILFRIIIYPITRKQYKSTYAMQKIQPKMKELQTKYADDKQKLQEEMTKLYADHKFNPLSGCLPMILQMPIFIALFQVLQELKARVGGDIAIPFYGIIPDLTLTPQQVFSFSIEGLVAVLPYVLLVLLFSVSMIVPMLLNKNADKQTKMMSGMMSLVMLWFGWISPAGVLLYWDTSSIIGVGQQLLSQRFLAKKDKEDSPIEVEPIEIEIERKERKARPTKKKK